MSDTGLDAGNTETNKEINSVLKRTSESMKEEVKWSEVKVTQSCPTLRPHEPMEFSRLEYWSGWPFPSPGDLPNPGLLGLILYQLSHQGGPSMKGGSPNNQKPVWISNDGEYQAVRKRRGRNAWVCLEKVSSNRAGVQGMFLNERINKPIDRSTHF